jgi:dynactin complex subunit
MNTKDQELLEKSAARINELYNANIALCQRIEELAGENEELSKTASVVNVAMSLIDSGLEDSFSSFKEMEEKAKPYMEESSTIEKEAAARKRYYPSMGKAANKPILGLGTGNSAMAKMYAGTQRINEEL